MATIKLKALKITPQTYPVYLATPGIQHLDLAIINDLFLVWDPEKMVYGGYGWLNEKDFNERYKFVDTVSFTDFTEIERLPIEDWEF